MRFQADAQHHRTRWPQWGRQQVPARLRRTSGAGLHGDTGVPTSALPRPGAVAFPQCQGHRGPGWRVLWPPLAQTCTRHRAFTAAWRRSPQLSLTQTPRQRGAVSPAREGWLRHPSPQASACMRSPRASGQGTDATPQATCRGAARPRSCPRPQRPHLPGGRGSAHSTLRSGSQPCWWLRGCGLRPHVLV